MTKTEIFLNMVVKILHAPRGLHSFDDVKAQAGSKATYHRWLNDIKGYLDKDGNPLFIEVIEEQSRYWSFNKSIFKYFYPSHLETAFYFEAYQKLGSLLDHQQFKGDIEELKSEVFQLNGRGEQFSRKFYYLSKTKSVNKKSMKEFQAVIVSALINNKLIKLRYNEGDYNVYPLSLCQYRDALYLIGYKEAMLESNIRKFKLNRIESIEVLDLEFKYPGALEWSPEEYFKNSSGLIQEETKNCNIRVYGHSRKHIFEKEFFNKTQIVSTADYDEYEIVYSNIDEFLGQIFVYAQDIEIVNDPELKRKFIEKASLAIELNGDRVSA